jgi:hypothetical protein
MFTVYTTLEVFLPDKEVKTIKDLDNIKKAYKAGDIVNIVVFRKMLRKPLG